MMTAMPASLLLVFVAVPIGIGLAIAGDECATRLRHTHWWTRRHRTP